MSAAHDEWRASYGVSAGARDVITAAHDQRRTRVAVLTSAHEQKRTAHVVPTTWQFHRRTQ
jgi:hypothetical protein